MTSDPAGATERTDLDDDEPLRREQMNDPVVRERLRQIFDEDREDPGITAEELPDFLREPER